MPNIEIKASFNNFDKARKICESMNAVFVGIDYQVDTYFKVPEGRLKLRESNLGGAQLIPYNRILFTAFKRRKTKKNIWDDA